MPANNSTECPLCRHDNPPENRFCGSCGARLRSEELVPRHRLSLAGRALPAKAKSAGKVVAAGAAAVVAKVALSWLRRRLSADDRPSAASRGQPAPYRRLVVYSVEEVHFRVEGPRNTSPEYAVRPRRQR
jgi:hypothetical protein